MKPSRFFYRFTKEQRRGIFALFLLMILIQAGYLLFSSFDYRTEEERSAEEKEWLSLQVRIDELKAQKEAAEYTLYPFNPNFISDYKGAVLGMSVAEIDRLHRYRATGKFVNTAAEFKKVTGVHDTLLAKLSPYFKFPDWVVQKEKDKQNEPSRKQLFEKDFKAVEESVAVLDINEALEEDLVKVYGIGPAFAKKILRRRAALGAFVSMEQMNDFAEFSPQAQQGLRKNFKVAGQPKVILLDINAASLNQLSYFPYFNKDIARAIVTRRSMKGKITSIEELLEINGFPVDKQEIIALYLKF